MHRAAFSSLEISGAYSLIELGNDELYRFLENVSSSDLSGFNVTIPHKEAVWKHLSPGARSFEAELIRAVNTVRIDSSGRLKAHNTDMGGFVQALELCGFLKQEDEPLERKAIVLGAGGAAKACIAGLISLAYKQILVFVRNPNDEHKEAIAELQGRSLHLLGQDSRVELVGIDSISAPSGRATLDSDFSALVNCTPLGLKDEVLPDCDWISFLFGSLAKNAFFFDTVYRKDGQATLLLEEAAKYKIERSADGLPMLACQAALAFEFWTGRLPCQKLMLDAARQVV